jgi:LPS export ABC transporter protein LptC
MKRLSLWLFYCLVLLAVLGQLYWAQKTPQKAESVSTESSADYFFEGLTIKRFNNTGKLINYLKAEQLDYFENQQVSKLINPKITIISDKSVGWKMVAKHGLLDHNKESIDMRDSVVVIQDSLYQLIDTVENDAPFKIETDYLHLDLKSNIANINQQTTHIVNDKNSK